MLLLKDGRLAEDCWRFLDDNETAPESDPVTVSLTRWHNERDTLIRRCGKIGLRLPNDVTVESIARDLERFDLIVLDFPRFTDGRAYSQARLLRSRFGYKGELRAGGNVLRDQLLFMRRCGFDSFAVGPRALREDWAKAFDEFDVFYQSAEDPRPFVMRQRLGRG
jgi:uncharacterized protein (DUF934 family)